MYDFIDKMLEDLPADMDDTVRTPAVEHLFTVNPPKHLPEETVIMFHHNVAKSPLPLEMGMTRSPDSSCIPEYLGQVSNEDDYKKLTRVMQY